MSNRSIVARVRSLVGVAVVALTVSSVLVPTTARADGPQQDGPAGDPELELAERYAPFVVVKRQQAPCDTDGEPFEPAPVEIVLDNPEVFLRQVGNDDPVAMRGPTGRDLFDLREGWYLDFPGDALDPGCVFEQDFRRFYDGQSVVYAHIATEDGRPGFIAVQYWLFWYHNPAKNDHEGDWEFVQVLFEADSVTDALASTPVAIGYAQHTGGERSSWGDAKLERVGDRPILYAAKGSHASYFGSSLYLGRSSAEGFGCDDTTGPSRRLDPAVVLLPDRVDDPDDPFAWLSFQGRWGQREPGFFNGPTGPFAKERWAAPVTWHEGLRSSSVVIPGGDRFGGSVVSTFCRSVEVGSVALSKTLRSPVAALVVMVGLLGVGVALARSTRWAPVVLRPLRSDRAIGQILRTSWRVWLRSPRAMLSIGLVYLPVALVTAGFQAGLLAIPFFDGFVELAGDRSWLAFILATTVGGIADLLTFLFVLAAVGRVVQATSEGSVPARVFPSVAEIGQLLRAVARGGATVIALLLSVVGIPWAIRQLVRYHVSPLAIVLEGRDGRAALDRSSELVRGRWWWTAGVVLGIEVVVATVGFALGVTVLLSVTTLPIWAFNLIGSVIYVLLVPVGAAAVTYAYGSLVARERAADDEAQAEPDTGSDTGPEARDPETVR